MKVRNQYVSDKAAIYHGDCVELITTLPDESVGFSIFSPPFAELYTYSDELADMGNSKDYNEFFTAFGFLVKELYRVKRNRDNKRDKCGKRNCQYSKKKCVL